MAIAPNQRLCSDHFAKNIEVDKIDPRNPKTIEHLNTHMHDAQKNTTYAIQKTHRTHAQHNTKPKQQITEQKWNIDHKDSHQTQ